MRPKLIILALRKEEKSLRNVGTPVAILQSLRPYPNYYMRCATKSSRFKVRGLSSPRHSRVVGHDLRVCRLSQAVSYGLKTAEIMDSVPGREERFSFLPGPTPAL